MDGESKTSIISGSPSQNGSNCPTPNASPLGNHSGSSESSDNFSPRHGTVIPNRIFVGGFDFKVTEAELWHIFSQYGTVKEVNIVINRSRLPKGYGFVTFENAEDAQKLLNDVNGIYFRDKRLSIRQAVRKQRNSGSSCSPVFSPEPLPLPCGPVYLTTSSGYPYTFHNGVAYFHSPRTNPIPQHWAAQPPPAMMIPQPCQTVYHQPAYHHYQPRYFPNQYQWNIVDSPVASSPVVYAQPEYLHHVSEGVSGQHALPIMEESTEHYEPVMQQTYPVFPVRAERVPRFVPPHQHGKNHMYSSFQVPPPPAAYSYFRDCHYLPEHSEPEALPPQGL